MHHSVVQRYTAAVLPSSICYITFSRVVTVGLVATDGTAHSPKLVVKNMYVEIPVRTGKPEIGCCIPISYLTFPYDLRYKRKWWAGHFWLTSFALHATFE